MATTRKAIVTRDRVVHTYAELWHASECVLANPAIALRMQSWPLVGRVAELGSLDEKRVLDASSPQTFADATRHYGYSERGRWRNHWDRSRNSQAGGSNQV